jgi:P-type Cu+ transporter
VAEVDGKLVLLGTHKYLESEGVSINPELEQSADRWRNQGMTVIYGAVSKKHAFVMAIADTIRQESAAVVAKLEKQGITPVMLTGDNYATAKAVAAQIGIKEFRAEVLPNEKEETIREIRKERGVVAMVGDGINDAPALALADVGIAMGGGTEVALESAGIALLRDDLNLVPQALRLSHATMSNIRQNLFWAFGYNVTLIPVAMGILYPFFGIRLDPMLAAGAMALSSVSVVLNALRLKRTRL